MYKYIISLNIFRNYRDIRLFKERIIRDQIQMSLPFSSQFSVK